PAAVARNRWGRAAVVRVSAVGRSGRVAGRRCPAATRRDGVDEGWSCRTSYVAFDTIEIGLDRESAYSVLTHPVTARAAEVVSDFEASRVTTSRRGALLLADETDTGQIVV